MIKNISGVQSLLNKITKEYQEREKRKQNVRVLRSLYLLRVIKERLTRIEALLQVQKYDLVFIGQVGVGKTTTICHLFNLIRQEEKRLGTKNGKTIKRIKELLSTGSGKTTICEVILRPSENTSLEIEPYADEEVEQFIEEFCAYIWQKIYPDSHATDVPPAELVRAIRNVVDLKEVTEDKVFVDKAVDFAKTFSKGKYETFKTKVLKRASLSKRKETKLPFTPQSNSIEEEKLWLENNFNLLNLVKLDKFSIPKKIYINVGSKILDFTQFSRFNSIIDTRGMDVVKDRKDLAEYIRNNDQAICIFTDRFPSAPTNVAELIGRYLTRESKDIDLKLVLLVIPRKGEPESIIGPDGPVDDREEGIARRKSDIEAAFAGQDIKFLPSNILFYDPLLFCLPDGRLDPDYEQEDIEQERNRIFSKVDVLITQKERYLLEEANSLEKIFQKILEGDDLSPNDEKIVADLKKTIEKCGELRFVNRSFVSRYIQLLRSYHVMVFRAVNNRFGVYDIRDIDTYFESKGITEALVRENLGESKSKIDGAILYVKKHASEMSGLQPIMDILQNQIDKYYEDITIQLAEEICRSLKTERLAPQDYFNPFWREVQNRWGQGPGYRNDVLEMYVGETQDLDTLFQQQLLELWKEEFMEKILSFFGESEE